MLLSVVLSVGLFLLFFNHLSIEDDARRREMFINLRDKLTMCSGYLSSSCFSFVPDKDDSAN